MYGAMHTVATKERKDAPRVEGNAGRRGWWLAAAVLVAVVCGYMYTHASAPALGSTEEADKDGAMAPIPREPQVEARYRAYAGQRASAGGWCGTLESLAHNEVEVAEGQVGSPPPHSFTHTHASIYTHAHTHAY